jgi:hypothetical protein
LGEEEAVENKNNMTIFSDWGKEKEGAKNKNIL